MRPVLIAIEFSQQVRMVNFNTCSKYPVSYCRGVTARASVSSWCLSEGLSHSSPSTRSMASYWQPSIMLSGQLYIITGTICF